jgi:O-antigen/teichoic acid export membrane protein
VIAVVGGGAFKAAVPVLRIQAVALLGGFLAATLGYTLLSLRMHGALLRVTLAALLVSIVLSLALVPSLGANGASIASAVCEFVVAAGYMLALARSHVRLRLHVTVLLRVAFAGAVAVGVLVLPLPSIVLWMIGSVVYVGLLLALRAFPSELRHILPGGDRARAMAVKRR